MVTVHILTQYIWPDAAPTGLYAEHLAIRLRQSGCNVRLVGGKGGYRALQRAEPELDLIHLSHRQGRRGNLLQSFAEYAAVTRAFRNYIEGRVRPDDVVVATSAPPNTVGLARTIQNRGARCIYWLQDYHPELIRGLKEYPSCLRKGLRRIWDRQLARWDRVVKIGANLGGPEHNCSVIRNWPTLAFDQSVTPKPKTALYLGNLGYGHDIPLLIKACEELRDSGFEISIRADGPGVRLLPRWINARPVCRDLAESRDALLRHEVHLVAAHPKITQAIFPSKIWNSLAAARRLVCTGFAGEMERELEAAKKARFTEHIEDWVQLITGFNTRAEIVSQLSATSTVSPRPELQPAALA